MLYTCRTPDIYDFVIWLQIWSNTDPYIYVCVTVWAKIWHVPTQTEIHFIAPAYSNYACLLPPLAKVDWSAFPDHEYFLPTM